MVQPNAPVEIYQLHILLLQINPAIWRRLHARSDTSIAILHDLLQIAFDWSDFHLHRFVIRGKAYGVSRLGGCMFATDARKVFLSQFRFRGGFRSDVANTRYIEVLQRQAAPPTVKQHMAAIRMLFSWLTEKGVLAMNPAREVKTERFSRTEGKTPAFVEGEVQRLLGVIETSTHTGLRDRALLGTLAYTFARIGAVVNLKVEDYYPSGKRFLLRFKEKGGKEKELPVHHKLEERLDEYLKATGLGTEPGSPLFPAALGKTGKLSRRPLVRTDAAEMLKRWLKQAGLPAHYSPHSFRATGITNFLENDGTLEAAQRIAGHADSRTTKLYDRRGQKVLLEDMERNAELGISLQMSSTVKCGVSRMDVPWERILA